MPFNFKKNRMKNEEKSFDVSPKRPEEEPQKLEISPP